MLPRYPDHRALPVAPVDGGASAVRLRLQPLAQQHPVPPRRRRPASPAAARDVTPRRRRGTTRGTPGVPPPPPRRRRRAPPVLGVDQAGNVAFQRRVVADVTARLPRSEITRVSCLSCDCIVMYTELDDQPSARRYCRLS